MIYLKMGDYDAAIECFWNAEKVHNETSNYPGLAICYINISTIYEIMGDKKLSLQYAKKAYSIYLEIDEIKRVSQTYITLANAHYLNQQYDSALLMLNEGITLLSDGENMIDLAEFYKSYQELFEKEKDYSNASYYLNKYQTLNDSIYNAKSSRQVHDLHNSYLYKKKDDENHFLRTEQKLQNQLLSQIQNQRYFLSMSTIGLFILIILFGYLFIRNKRFGLEIERSNREIQHTTGKLEQANEKLFISQSDIGIVNEELTSLNKACEAKIEDRSSVIIKSRFIMSNILEISSDYLFESLKKINYVSEEVSSYGKKRGEKSLKKVLNIINRSDELFGHLIELREIAKRNVIIEKISCEDLMVDVWSDLVKTHNLDNLLPRYTNISSHFDSDYILSRALIYNILDYIFIQSSPKTPDIAMSFMSESSEFIIDVQVTGQLQIPSRMKKSLSYLFQQAQNGSKDQIVLYMIKISLDKLHGKIDFNNFSIDESVVSIKLPFPKA